MGFLFAVSFFLFLKSLYLFVVQIDMVFKMFVILQKYDFSSKSQHYFTNLRPSPDVCDTAKVRFFKQITTWILLVFILIVMFVILQKYDFSSKSQPRVHLTKDYIRCLWYCKSTIFQANHNNALKSVRWYKDVCDTAKVRFFKQITTFGVMKNKVFGMFVILQKYDFSSKSQRG